MDGGAGWNAAVVSVCCDDPDDARSFGRDVYHPHTLSVSPSPTPFEMRLRAAALGPVTVGVLGYGDEVRVETDPFETSYQVNVPLRGRLACWEGDRRVVADPSTAVIFGPHAGTGFSGFAGGGDLLGIKIATTVVEDAVATATGRRNERPVLPATLDLRSGRGAEWWSLARSFTDLLAVPQGLVSEPLVMRPFARAVVAGLLAALDVAQEAGGRRVPSPTVRRAMRLLEERCDEPLTVAEVAAAVGASTRTLQTAFRRDLGTTPMGHLRDVRLERAHAELLDGDPASVTVGEVARRWGFDHLGRFATAHQRRFGSLPSAALRRGA